MDTWKRSAAARRRGRWPTFEASAPKPVRLSSGLVLLAKPAAADTPRLALAPGLKPVEQLGHALDEIEARYGRARREWVANELEYAAAQRP